MGRTKADTSSVADGLAVAIGERLMEVRGKVSRSTFAETLGVHPNTLQFYDLGKRIPDGEFLVRLHQRVGILPTWLLLGEGPRDIAEEHHQSSVDPELLEKILIEVERFERERGSFSAKRKSKFIAALYAHFKGREQQNELAFRTFLDLITE